MKKGDTVLVHAVIHTHYMANLIQGKDSEIIHEPKGSSSLRKCLVRHKVTPWQGLVVGTSYRATGYYNAANYGSYDSIDFEPAYLLEDKRHLVTMIQPLDIPRWQKPTACLEQDLELIQKEATSNGK